MRIRRLIISSGVIVGLLLCLKPAASLAVNEDNLPDIGSPADSVLSKAQELQIGRSIYNSLRMTDRVITDPEVQEYVQDVGQKLVANAQDGDFKFQFFVVNDPAINAFALPGGYIGVHSGLLMATRSESELAGVLAHEIAHVTQRHISRAIFANQRESILSMAAMLGAILVGAATGSGDLIQGAVVGAQSLAVQQQINFTRANEYEADRVGVGILANSGFDPRGMPDFFSTLNRMTGSRAGAAPEFLRTHPVTVNRIAETASRIAELPETEVNDASGYGLTRARLALITANTPEAALKYFEGLRKDPEQVGKLGLEYGIALAKLELGRYQEAQEDFERLLATNEEIIHFHTALAATQLALDDRDGVEKTFKRALELFPRNRPLTIRYAEALMQYDRASEAHQVLLDLYNQVPPTSEQVRQIALAASAAGDVADAHYYMAEYHLLTGNLNMASDQLRLALSIPELDDVQRARFRSRLEQIQEVLLEAEKGERRRKRAAS